MHELHWGPEGGGGGGGGGGGREMPGIAEQGVGGLRGERKIKWLQMAWGRDRGGGQTVDDGRGQPQHVQCVPAPHSQHNGPQLPLPLQCDVPLALPPQALQLPW